MLSLILTVFQNRIYPFMVRLDFIVEPGPHHPVGRTSDTPVGHAHQYPALFGGRQTHHRTSGKLFFRAIVVVVNRIVTQAVHRRNADVGAAVHRTFFDFDPLKVVP